MTTPTPRLEWRSGDVPGLPADATAVRWPDGTVECRARLTDPAGSLLAEPGTVGDVLTDPAVDCTRCSDACSE